MKGREARGWAALRSVPGHMQPMGHGSDMLGLWHVDMRKPTHLNEDVALQKPLEWPTSGKIKSSLEEEAKYLNHSGGWKNLGHLD